MRLIFPIGIFAVFILGVSLCEAEVGSDNQDTQSSCLPAKDKNFKFEEIDRLVDQLLNSKKNGNTDTAASSECILNLIYKKRAEDRRKATKILLRMYQYSNVESSEFITQMLNEMFYYHPAIVVSALNEIESHLFVEHRNEKYVNYLIQSSCGLPPIVSEDININQDILSENANRIISEIESLNVNKALKYKVINIVTQWK